MLVARYFAGEQADIDKLSAALESVAAKLAELEEEQLGEEDAFSEARTDAADGKVGKVTRATVTARLKEIKGNKDAKDEALVLNAWLALNDDDTALKKQIKEAEAALDAKAYARYPRLTAAEVKTLVVDDKWLAQLDGAIHGEMDRVSQQLTQRVQAEPRRRVPPRPERAPRIEVDHRLPRRRRAVA